MISSIIFAITLVAAIVMFAYNVKIIMRNVNLGKELDISDQGSTRWKTMFLVAIGQGKMTKRPLAGILHIFVYGGFIIVNIEMLEIMIDGIAGTHRIFSFIGDAYPILISGFEFFGLAVMLACIIFLFRRNIVKVKRFHNDEMTQWPRLDGNIILMTEVLLMFALFTMNAADSILQTRGLEHYTEVGTFAVSAFLIPLYDGLSNDTLILLERGGWWFHIVGVFAFLNYIPYSKHFHVFAAFPNVYYSKLQPKAFLANMPSVTKEVQIMLGVIEDEGESDDVPSFGAKDITDLSWKNILDSYTCTECGRCTAVCPANQTGKMLSPRKIMMATRDRVEEVGKNIAKNGKDFDDKKSLLYDYITAEEIWACTTCNACTEECPVNIDQVSIITSLRRFMVMEESSSPAPINSMITNTENNGAPWQYSAADRANWADDIYVPE